MTPPAKKVDSGVKKPAPAKKAGGAGSARRRVDPAPVPPETKYTKTKYKMTIETKKGGTIVQHFGSLYETFKHAEFHLAVDNATEVRIEAIRMSVSRIRYETKDNE